MTLGPPDTGLDAPSVDSGDAAADVHADRSQPVDATTDGTMVTEAAPIDAPMTDAVDEATAPSDSADVDAAIFDAGLVDSAEGGCAVAACGDVCVDLANDPLNCGRCGHDCQGGGCALGMCQPIVLVPMQSGATGVAIDATSIYWTASLDGTVMKANLDGSNVTVLADNQFTPTDIVVDSTSVYWLSQVSTVFGHGLVSRVPLAGGPLTVLASGLPSTGAGLAVHAGSVYFESDGTFSAYDAGPVMTVPIGGGDVAAAVSGALLGEGVAADDTDIYWGGSDGGVWGSVTRTAIDGGSSTMLTSLFGYAPSALVIDEANVYWADLFNVSQTPLSGGGVTTLTSNVGDCRALAIDDASVYWTTINAGNVQSAPKGGGPVTTLATVPSNAWGIAVNSTSVYWALRANVVGAIMKVAKP